MPDAGDYRLRISVEQDLQGRVSYEDVTPPGVPIVRVVDGPPSSLELTVDPATIQQTVQRLRDGR